MSTTIDVAAHLTAIVEVAERLEEQALSAANDQLMPGGLAMVALGPVANLEAVGWKLDTAEQTAIAQALREGRDPRRANVDVADDDDWEPPLQTLLFWSEDLRREHGQEFEPTPGRMYPTIVSEANFIRWGLDWLWENEPHWDDFAEDIAAARARLDDLLAEGLRAKAGVPCLSAECEGALLIQPVANRREHHVCDGHEHGDGKVCGWPHRRCPHDRGGLRDTWKCPRCERRYEAEDYRRAVAQSHYLNAEWLPLEDACKRASAKPGTVKVWATRGHVRRRRDVATGVVVYHVGDIERRVLAREITSV